MPTDPEPPKRRRAAALVPLLIAVLLGAGLGYLVANFGEQIWGGLRWRPMTALVGSACLVVAVLVQFVLHELGHLVAGLLTGYRFSVVRTQYASALLAERDPGKAAALRARFEQLAPDYPRPIELVGERELMDHVDSLVGQ